jgi:outer membrane receptor protein involved in Fe transport
MPAMIKAYRDCGGSKAPGRSGSLRPWLLATAATLGVAANAQAQTPTPTVGPAPAPRAAPTATPPAAPPPAPAAGTAKTPAPPASETPHGDSEAAAAPDAVEQVTVTGRRSDMVSDIDRRSYNVASDLQATTGSIADVLRNVPQVEVDVGGNVSLRGDQNVTILIDGRPSGAFQGEGRGDALQNLPADQIERVEVITNPSAALRPDGTGGVINLVTKRNRRAGRYGTVRGSIGSEGRGAVGVSGAYTGQKLTVSGDAGYRRIGSDSVFTTEREQLTGGVVVPSRQDGTADNEGSLNNARLSAEYNLDSASRISVEARRFEFGIDFEGATRFRGGPTATGAPRDFVRAASGGFERNNSALSTSYRRRFSGEEHELVADLSFDNTQGENRNTAVLAGAGLRPDEGFGDVRGGFDEDQLRLKVDYNRPLPNESRLRTGYEGEVRSSEFDLFGRRGPTRETAVVDARLTNAYTFEQVIHAGYATYESTLRGLRYQLGLRLEQVNTELDQLTQDRRAENDYFRAYPTLNLQHALSETQEVRLSYSKRVQRPGAQDLNPFLIFIDPFNLRSGNPDLLPQETQSFEVGWQRRSGSTYYLATLFYRDSENGVTDVVVPARDRFPDLGGLAEGALLTTRENLAERRTFGLELVANGRFTPKLTYNISATALQEEIGAALVPGLGFSPGREGASVGGRFNLNWQATERDFFQLNASVTGRRLQPQGSREPTGILNLGYRRKLNERLNLLLTGQDVLDSFKDEVVIDTPLLRDRTVRTGLQGGRSLFVGLTYSFSAGPPQRGRQPREPGFEFETGGGPGG